MFHHILVSFFQVPSFQHICWYQQKSSRLCRPGDLQLSPLGLREVRPMDLGLADSARHGAGRRNAVRRRRDIFLKGVVGEVLTDLGRSIFFVILF